MAERRPLVMIGGRLRELPDGDTLPSNSAPFVPITQDDYDALSPPDAGTLYIIVEGPAGGAGAAWLEVTQAEYDELDPPDDATLYIVID